MAAPRAQPTTLYEALRHVCADLESITSAYALVGGLAVSARAEPRTTRDVDLAVSVADDREALLARDDRTRPQDADDLRALIAVASTAERRRVSSAIKMIAARGFARGRDLAALWRAVQRR